MTQFAHGIHTAYTRKQHEICICWLRSDGVPCRRGGRCAPVESIEPLVMAEAFVLPATATTPQELQWLYGANGAVCLRQSGLHNPVNLRPLHILSR